MKTIRLLYYYGNFPNFNFFPKYVREGGSSNIIFSQIQNSPHYPRGGGWSRKLLISSTFVTFSFWNAQKSTHFIAYLMSTLRTFLVALQMHLPTHPSSHRTGILRRFVGLISIKNNYAGLCEAEKSIPQSLQTVSTKLDPTRGGGLISYFNFVQLDLT